MRGELESSELTRDYHHAHLQRVAYEQLVLTSDQKAIGGRWVSEQVVRHWRTSTLRTFRVLDVGCGNGEFARSLLRALCDRASIWEESVSYVLLEPCIDFQTALTELVTAEWRGIDVCFDASYATLDSWLDRNDRPRFDLILFAYVWNYLPVDTRESTLQRCLCQIRRGGALCVAVCDSGSWIAGLRRIVESHRPDLLLPGFTSEQDVLAALARAGCRTEVTRVYSSLGLRDFEVPAHLDAKGDGESIADVVCFLAKVRREALADGGVRHWLRESASKWKRTDTLPLCDAYVWAVR